MGVAARPVDGPPGRFASGARAARPTGVPLLRPSRAVRRLTGILVVAASAATDPRGDHRRQFDGRGQAGTITGWRDPPSGGVFRLGGRLRTLRTEQCVKSQCVSPSAGRRGSPCLDQPTVRTETIRPDTSRSDRNGRRGSACRGGRLTNEEPSQRIPRDSEMDLYGEFDPGSGRTLAACLTHASRTVNRASARGSVANGCVTRGQPASDTGITPGNRG
jgi:hypothetical protein